MRGQSALVRQWTLLRTLCARPGGVTVRELVQELGVSEKTVRRDLETFRKVGFPLQEQVGEHGCKWWRIEPCADQPGLSFAFDEAVALHLGRRLLDPLAGTVFWDAAQRAFRKLQTVLSPQAMRYVDKFASVFHRTRVGASDYSEKGELIDQLMMAIEDRHSIHITYHSLQATEPTTYDVYPLGMIYHRGSLYLVGWAPRRDRVQHWKVDRIEDVYVENLHFAQPDAFDLQEHLAKSFGVFHGQGDVCVKVRFSSAAARYVEEGCWHPSQRLTRQKDGSLVAEFRLSTTEEIKRWILSFGEEAEVLEPEGLREEMARELHTLLRRYESGRISHQERTRVNG